MFLNRSFPGDSEKWENKLEDIRNIGASTIEAILDNFGVKPSMLTYGALRFPKGQI